METDAIDRVCPELCSNETIPVKNMVFCGSTQLTTHVFG